MKAAKKKSPSQAKAGPRPRPTRSRAKAGAKKVSKKKASKKKVYAETGSKLVVRRVPIASLQEDPKNVRRHPGKNLDAIVASLEAFGLQTPIVVDSGGVVRAGNARLEAARRLGWTEIEVVVSDLPEELLKLYAVADNRTTDLSHFDSEALLGALEGTPNDLLLAAGYTANDYERLWEACRGDPLQDPAPLPPPEESDPDPGNLCPSCGRPMPEGKG